ncbi:hypothetical protein PYWP30_01353 [Pyrobaculum sp. WP30]|nr:hypothetical protein PYWP30_01353 [Pyrobaculum sp. WP30]
MPALYKASTYVTVEDAKHLKVLRNTYTNEQNTIDRHEVEGGKAYIAKQKEVTWIKLRLNMHYGV